MLQQHRVLPEKKKKRLKYSVCSTKRSNASTQLQSRRHFSKNAAKRILLLAVESQLHAWQIAACGGRRGAGDEWPLARTQNPLMRKGKTGHCQVFVFVFRENTRFMILLFHICKVSAAPASSIHPAERHWRQAVRWH